MEKAYASGTPKTRGKLWQRLCCLLLVFASFISLLPVSVLAEDIWDGSGSGGNGNGTTISTGASLESTTAYYSIMGYRFSVYNEGGTQVGSIIDIQIRSTATWYRAASKKSHIDLNRAYGTYVSSGMNPAYAPALGSFTTSSSGVYSAPSGFPDTRNGTSGPTQVGTWLGTGTNAKTIAQNYCGVSTYDANSHYIIVEPMFAVNLFGDGKWYALTMAELAVFQSGQVQAAREAYNAANPGTYVDAYGNPDVDGWSHVRPSSTQYGQYVNNVGRFTSAVFGRWLYATNNYSALGTYPVTDDMLVNDNNGTPSIKLPGYDGSWISRNTAEAVLKYQVGMGIFSHIAEDEK